jgi:hypothetical protein
MPNWDLKLLQITVISAILLISPQFLNLPPIQATTITAPAYLQISGASGTVSCQSPSDQATLTLNGQGTISGLETVAAITSGTFEIRSSMGLLLFGGQINSGGFTTTGGGIFLFGRLNPDNNCSRSGGDITIIIQCGTGRTIAFLGGSALAGATFTGDVQCIIGDTKQECKNFATTKEDKKECKDLPPGKSGSQGR